MKSKRLRCKERHEIDLSSGVMQLADTTVDWDLTNDEFSLHFKSNRDKIVSANLFNKL
jgi:ethanolamine utilization protein EutQ (cupin superfamily)